LLITAILLQQRGGGLSSVFGGDGSGFYRTRRGIEKMIFIATIILAALFMLTALLNVILR
jgi:preprotein translocase subunit SecG